MRCVLASFLFLFACRNTAFPACGPDGHPPTPTVENGTLFRGSPASCPKTEPKPGDACKASSEAEASCQYAVTARGPCEFDSCSCQAGTWSCGEAME